MAKRYREREEQAKKERKEAVFKRFNYFACTQDYKAAKEVLMGYHQYEPDYDIIEELVRESESKNN